MPPLSYCFRMYYKLSVYNKRMMIPLPTIAIWCYDNIRRGYTRDDGLPIPAWR